VGQDRAAAFRKHIASSRRVFVFCLLSLTPEAIESMNTGDSILRHCAELNRCNQRGGRMLSIFDLINAGSLDVDLAAFLIARISRGASFLVGARPGGAGKTTVMCALLNFIPPSIDIVPATRERLEQAAGPCRCWVCHEIGAGPYFAYLWGADLRDYCALSDYDHLLAANLHADDIEEARAQVCGENRVPASHFEAFNLAIFLRVTGRNLGANRFISHVYVSNGCGPHTLLFRREAGQRDLLLPAEHKDEWVGSCREFLETCLRENVCTIEDTRRRFVDFLEAQGSQADGASRSSG